MDRIQAAANVVEALNKFESKDIEAHDFVSKVCDYFDLIKNEELSESDKRFLIFLSSKVGIPHYYDMLRNFDKERNIMIKNIGLDSFSSLLYESTLYTDKSCRLHRYQKEILEKFNPDKSNRFFLSASTSFGKTFLVYEIIKKMKYKNVVLIFPTIALLSENLQKIKEDPSYIYFDDYAVHTLSDFADEFIREKNLFIFTPERFLSFLDKNKKKIVFDFVFVDEVYKIDNEYLIEEELKENERDLAYRMAIFFAISEYKNIDILLAGPYINFYNSEENNYNPSFDLFLKDFGIELIDKNQYEIVNKKVYLASVSSSLEDKNFYLNFKGCNTKGKKLEAIIREVLRQEENLIVYCAGRPATESFALKMIKDGILNDRDYSEYNSFIEHLEGKYNKEWIILKALKSGIGIHHGLVPKYIQKETIRLFNSGNLKVLFSTTTITEGVNTSAKNILALNHKKGKKPLHPFDAKNIAGRAGRFLYHYSGRVFSLEEEFINIFESEGEGIKHKNYDKGAKKTEVDIEITKQDYLTEEEIQKRNEIRRIQEEKGIPDEIIKQFRIISREDKIYLYDQIRNLSEESRGYINALINKNNQSNVKVDFDGFQVILDILRPKIKNKSLEIFIDKKKKPPERYGPNKEYSILIYLVHFYLKDDGFRNLFENRLETLKGKAGGLKWDEKKDQIINSAMRETSDLVYNVFKYQLVKYLGVFNLMYKFEASQATGVDFNEIHGIDRLLSKLEYNALSPEARIASDYGSTDRVIKYFDTVTEDRKNIVLDKFEISLLSQIEKLLNND